MIHGVVDRAHADYVRKQRAALSGEDIDTIFPDLDQEQDAGASGECAAHSIARSPVQWCPSCGCSQLLISVGPDATSARGATRSRISSTGLDRKRNWCDAHPGRCKSRRGDRHEPEQRPSHAAHAAFLVLPPVQSQPLHPASYSLTSARQSCLRGGSVGVNDGVHVNPAADPAWFMINLWLYQNSVLSITNSRASTESR